LAVVAAAALNYAAAKLNVRVEVVEVQHLMLPMAAQDIAAETAQTEY
jgi:hypothetical protein